MPCHPDSLKVGAVQQSPGGEIKMVFPAEEKAEVHPEKEIKYHPFTVYGLLFQEIIHLISGAEPDVEIAELELRCGSGFGLGKSTHLMIE